jgi:hypothetical protein
MGAEVFDLFDKNSKFEKKFQRSSSFKNEIGIFLDCVESG